MRAESGYAEYPFIRAATADELSIQCRHLLFASLLRPQSWWTSERYGSSAATSSTRPICCLRATKCRVHDVVVAHDPLA